MWLSNRRLFLLGGLSATAACGFTPVYGPQGGGTRLQNAVGLPKPVSENDYSFNLRFEERMGLARGDGAPFALTRVLWTEQSGLGSTSAGVTTRYRILGRATYTLTDVATKKELTRGRTEAFTGYSTTGSTVATRAAERDAQARLMVILADQVIDNLILAAADLPT